MKYSELLVMFKKVIKKISVIETCELEKTDVAVLKMKDGHEIKIKLAVSKDGYPKQIKEIISNYDSSLYCVILAPYITEHTARICEDANFGFVDLAGNCLFSFESIYLEIKGNKNDQKSKRALKSIYERSSVVSSILLRTMLADTQKVWRLKELSETVGCSIGQVSKVKDFLLKQSYIEQTEKGICVIDPRSLMKEWSDVYSGSAEEEIACYSLDGIPVIESKMANMKKETGIDCILTGFAGGVRYQPVVRYQKIHSLIRYEDLEKAIDYLGLKKVDTGANVIFIVKYNECVGLNARLINGNKVASPVQVYLDCMSLKGRGEEIAEAILEREICK